jgi:predicted nucleic acid-binding protein
MPEREQNKVILDSGVIAAIFFKEAVSDRAQKIAESYNLITLDLAFIEVANVAWKRVTIFKESKELMEKALKSSSDFISSACDVIASKEFLEDAFKIAVIEKITVYDSLFVAASEREKVQLFTTDGKLYEKLNKKRNVKLI